MISKTKAGAAIREVFPDSNIVKIEKFKKGLVNETYSVGISNPKKELVLRVYPKEGWKAEKEAYLYELIAEKTDVPVPEVYAKGKPYLILSKIDGRELPLRNELVKKAGEHLAKIHSIKMPYFGWIINKEIKPKFDRWQDFLSYDLEHKLKMPIAEDIIRKIKDYFHENKKLLDIDREPCLLHKDYHRSHILAKNNEITGIIDLEWAIAGHSEMDIIKSIFWMFENKPALEKSFLQGYKRYGSISNRFYDRKKLYELLILVSSLNFSYELKNKKWFNYNLKKIKEVLR